MLKAKSPSWLPGREKGKVWRECKLVVLAMLLGLAACNPVDTWRDWTGASRNDPDPDTTPNTGNLAAGQTSDYPNLATVPPPPVRAMTAAERDKLTQSLIADRANARYSDEQLRAGFSTAAAPPPPPGSSSASDAEGEQSVPAAAASSPPTAPSAAQPAHATAASQPPAAPSAAPVAPVASAALAAPVASALPAASAAPLSPSIASRTTGNAVDKSAVASPGAGPPAAQAGGKALGGPGGGLRKQGEPPEPGPMESSLEVPEARATPQPEQIEAAPAAPQLPPPSKAASTANPLPSGLAAGGALGPRPLPEAKAAAGFEPAPPAAELPPPPAPTRSAAAESGKGGQKPPTPVATPVAEIKFVAESTSLTEGDRKKLETIVPLYQQSPGKVRIVGYAEAGSSAVEQLNGYRAALDRAQAVAAVLTQAGIPSDKIQVEAAPADTNSGEGRAEVLVEH